MPPRDWTPDPEFQARLLQHAERGFPPGEAPDCANFPDRALAESGWTAGRFPRIDPMTGRVLKDGEPGLIEQQRAAAQALWYSARRKTPVHYHMRLAADGRWRGYWVTYQRRGKPVRHTPKNPLPAWAPGQPAD